MAAPLSSLEELSVSGNDLQEFDITMFPALHSLNVDHNMIPVLQGVSNAKQLSRLSWRDQRLSSPPHVQSLPELEHLHVSSNSIPIFKPLTTFLNLRTLELASSGLHSLSPDFGRRCPNIRTLNLNFNAVRDLRPLRGIHRLVRLYLVGNRISKLRQTAAALDSISEGLQELDLRNNPLTLGFLLPLREPIDDKRLVLQGYQQEPADARPNSTWEVKYLLPRPDGQEDRVARERFDEATKVRRRVYEVLLMNTCPSLALLDGLEVERTDAGKKDEVWRRLREMGVLKTLESQV